MNRPTQDIILDCVADGVFTVDLDWRVTSFNRAAERVTGVSREQAIGQKCFDVFCADVCQSSCVMRRTIETGEPIIDMRVNILDSEGRRVPISISTSLLRDEDGRVVGGVETFRDLSAIELLRKEIDRQYTFEDIVSKNHEIQRIFDILPDVAASGSTVLIEGPSGSGKELFARAIHNLSGRRKDRYVAVNCAALPDTLLESELFGYVKGAFTDARRDKPGRFAMARGGTLFLDEIGDISAALQVKLLRVLEEKEYEPLGATAPVKADARIIAATNRDLREQVALGRFRDDLFYRLNVVRIALPPLSRRREDIPLLVDHFIRKHNAEKGRDVQGMTDEALSVLMRYDFPGNVRELENIVERSVVLCRRPMIEKDCLPPEVIEAVEGAAAAGGETETNAEATPPQRREPLADAEAQAIVEALRRHNGHRAKTAEDLGIDKTTLWRKMKKHGIEYP